MTTCQTIVVGKKFKEIQLPTESIYNLISQTHESRKRQPRYQSIYNNQTQKLYESAKKSHQTMGFAKTPLNSPSEFLKKYSGDLRVKIEPRSFHCLSQGHLRPPVPRRNDVPHPVLHDCDAKNFIKMNVLNIIRQPPLKPAKKVVDTIHGDSFFLEFSGLVPKFSRKKEFGECPRYLVRLKRDLEFSNELYLESISENKLLKLSQEERHDLLEGLRMNWEKLNKKYLSLPLLVDTKTRKIRKVELEKKIGLLERDINFLEKNEDNEIYILPD